jgi:hypothetical protein
VGADAAASIALRPGQIYLQQFPTSDRKWQVSSSASVSPRRSRDGKELFFDSAGTLHAVRLSGDGAGLNPGAATSLFQGLLNQQHSFDLGADGRVLAVLGAGLGTGVGGGQPVKVIVNWTSGLSLAR